MKKHWRRSQKKVLLDELLPERIMPDSKQRNDAIEEVLRRIPGTDYKKIKEKVGFFVWFIPHHHPYGMVWPFPKPTSCSSYEWAIYLSPALEKASWDIIIAVVAHELAHIVLNHQTTISAQDQEAKEDEAYTLICKWGFEKEAKTHKRLIRRRESRRGGNHDRTQRKGAGIRAAGARKH